MTEYTFDTNLLSNLKGRTILITGAANGIGKATTKIAHENGANVIIGDRNEEAGLELVAELKQRVIFRRTDVSKFDDVLSLFEAGWKQFGVIHSVMSNAGMNREDLFSCEFDGNGKLLPPNLDSIDVNLIGMVYMVKCALYYFAKWPETRCQIVMTASAASYLDTPPLYLYCAAKSGVLGLMRGLRSKLPEKNVTINVIAPWMTITDMLLPVVIEKWGELPANEPWGVAYGILLPIVQTEINGKAFFIAGHKIIEFEDRLLETQPSWMGEQLSADIAEGQRRLIS